MDESSLKSKFRGALVGVVIGDALGAPFEGMQTVSRPAIEDVLDADVALGYTDDTHMTIGIAGSLIERGGFDGAHMAEVLARNYFAQPWRGYGPAPPEVFRRLREGARWDQAARTLFGGQGSFGNGSAMRVTPVGLLAHRDLDQVADLAEQTSIITHTHMLGIEGAVLQACAVAILVRAVDENTFDVGEFVAQLRARVRAPKYQRRLDTIEDLLPDSSADRVVEELGHSIAAHESVPTAIYTFLRNASLFTEAVTYAIELGGDTDTIASMAGALSGAHLGLEAIPEGWRNRVEGTDSLIQKADALAEMALPPRGSAAL